MATATDTNQTIRGAAGLAALLCLALAAVAAYDAFIPAGGGIEAMDLAQAALATVAFLASLRAFAGARASAPAASQAPAAAPEAPRPAAPPRPVPEAPEPGAEALMLLSLLQEKGRFLDFVMEDVAAYSNEQVGAAARVVHQGCRAVVAEAFSPVPVAPAENARMVLEPGYDAEEFRLVGRAEGAPPYDVKVTHKGWRAGKVNLPRRTRGTQGNKAPAQHVIVPAEVAA